jgi:hypothetical protein
VEPLILEQECFESDVIARNPVIDSSKSPGRARALLKVAKSVWPTGHSLFGFQAISRDGLDAFDFLGDGDRHLFCASVMARRRQRNNTFVGLDFDVAAWPPFSVIRSALTLV